MYVLTNKFLRFRRHKRHCNTSFLSLFFYQKFASKSGGREEGILCTSYDSVDRQTDWVQFLLLFLPLLPSSSASLQKREVPFLMYMEEMNQFRGLS